MHWPHEPQVAEDGNSQAATQVRQPSRYPGRVGHVGRRMQRSCTRETTFSYETHSIPQHNGNCGITVVTIRQCLRLTQLWTWRGASRRLEMRPKTLAANGTPYTCGGPRTPNATTSPYASAGRYPGRVVGVGPGSRVCAANPGIRRSGPPATKAPACVLHTGASAGRIGDGTVC